MTRAFYVLPLLLAAALATGGENARNWIEVRSPGFTIITNSSEKQGRRIASQFERMRAIFQQAYPDRDDDTGLPVVVLAVRNKNQFLMLEPNAYHSKKSLPLHGMFVRAADTNYILMRLDSQAGNPYPVVYHEYTHLFLRESDERMPLWLNEGLAEFYQSTEIYGQDVLLGPANQQHLLLLRQEQLLPLTTLFTVDEKSPYYLEEKKGEIFYAECWALTHYLTLKDYAEKTTKVQQYIALANSNVDPVTAAIRVFGDLRKLQRALELYIAQPSLNHFETKISSKVEDSRFDVKLLTPAQAQTMQAGFLAGSGRAELARALFPSVALDQVAASANMAFDQPVDRARPEKMPDNATRTDVPCPLSQILQGASERATEMVDNLQRFTATESILHTEFKKNGAPRRGTNQLFSYVAEIDAAPSGAFWVEEYRTAKMEVDSPPISDTGTAAFALIFHPQKIGNFQFRCEGLTDVQGAPAWQLRFEESPDPSRSFHQIRISHTVYPLRFQGHAWIAVDSHQILRLQTDLVMPIPQIRLEREHLDITYAAVDFDKSKFTVWLPESASMQISYRGRRYQRIHKFSHFQLFLVVTEEKIKEPVAGPSGE